MNVLQEQQQKEMLKYELCSEILVNARNELFLGMRFMDVALSALQYLPDSTTKSWGCDGRVFHFHSDFFLLLYQESEILVNRGYLHQIFHCLFGHIWNFPDQHAPDPIRQEADKTDWNLACDFTAEYLIDSLPLRCVRRPLSAWRREWYRKMEGQMHTITAQ